MEREEFVALDEILDSMKVVRVAHSASSGRFEGREVAEDPRVVGGQASVVYLKEVGVPVEVADLEVFDCQRDVAALEEFVSSRDYEAVEDPLAQGNLVLL